jgi:hypothetical protein
MTITLPEAVREYVDSANRFDLDRLMGSFADDALVNDARREFWGQDAIRAWAEKEMVGDRVTMQVTRVVEHHGGFIVDAAVDGDFDKTNLPDPVILTHYVTVQAAKIAQLIIILNAPAAT